MLKNSIRNFIVVCTGIVLTYCAYSYTTNPTQIAEQVSPGINLHILVNDITKLHVDAIVNAANKQLLPGGGVCGAIYDAAEQKTSYLTDYMEKQYPHGIQPGQAVISPSFLLKDQDQGIKYIIHAVGPIYKDYADKKEAAQLLKNAYSNSLNLAEQNNLKSIAFPFISSAIYGYPKKDAAQIALATIIEFVKRNAKQTSLTDIALVLFSEDDFHIFQEALSSHVGRHTDIYIKTVKYRQNPCLYSLSFVLLE